MNQSIPNIVIVHWPRGYVAHLRYDNRFKDKDISSPTYNGLHGLIRKELAA